MINEKSVQDLLKQIQDRFPHPQILSILDCSKGVDQQVKIVTVQTCANNKKSRKSQNSKIQKLIVKYPKQQPDKIQNQIIGCTQAANKGIPVPQIYYHNHQFLIQSFLQGKDMMSLRMSQRNYRQVYFELGVYLRKLHSNTGTGFGKLKTSKLMGQYQDKSKIFENICNEIKTLKQHTEHFSPYFINRMQIYIKQCQDIIKKVESTTSLLHGDCSQDNIIANTVNEPNKSKCKNKYKIEGIVDFGDLSMGSPMEDFSRLYLQNYGSYKWQALIQGYGSHDLREIQFYTVYLCSWLMNSLIEKQRFGYRLRKLKMRVKCIINKNYHLFL